MRKLLWIGDAACQSGFAKCTHHTLEALRQTWDVHVLGINYRGDPHSYPYPIYPAFVPGGDLFGVHRVGDMIERVRPEMVVIQNDPWNIPAYMKKIKQFQTPPPVVGAIAVDGKNCRGTALNELDRAIFWTRFAQVQAERGGMKVPSGVVPLGVDLDLFTPGDRDTARTELELPAQLQGTFIVLNVNRNQPRKRLDLTIQYFAEWIRHYDVRDAYLYLHVAPTGEMGYNCEQLARYYGINSTRENTRLILMQPDTFRGPAESWLVKTYQAANVQMSTTQGEGWGLTTMEGMACGIPQIVPDWSALGEWPGDAVVKVPCPTQVTTQNGINVVGGVPDKMRMIAALDLLYRDGDVHQNYVGLGLEQVSRPEFRWENIARAFAAEVELAAREHVYG